MTPHAILILATLSLLCQGWADEQQEVVSANGSIVFPDSFNASGNYRTAAPLSPSSDNVQVLELPVLGVAASNQHQFIPRGCSGDEAMEGFCVAPDDYPDTALIRSLVRNRTTTIEAQLLFSDAVQQRSRPRTPVPIGTRSGVYNDSSITTYTSQDTVEYSSPGLTTGAEVSFVEESPICDSTQSYVHPRTARNLEKKWRFVINIPGDDTGDEEYVQAVKVERCLRPDRSCNIDSVTGSETVCRQKYTLRRLLALSNSGQQYIDSFEFPSCCVCYEKRSFHLELREAVSRIGIPIDTSETEIDLTHNDPQNNDHDGK